MVMILIETAASTEVLRVDPLEEDLLFDFYTGAGYPMPSVVYYMYPMDAEIDERNAVPVWLHEVTRIEIQE